MEPPVLATVLDTVPVGVYVLDRAGRITSWNRGAELATGFSAEEVLGRSCSDGLLVHIDDRGALICGTHGCPVSCALDRGTGCERRALLRHKAGHRTPALTRSAPVRDGDGAIVGAVVVFTDESASAAASEEIERLRQASMLDPLTGIGNRRLAERGLHTMFDELDRYGWSFGAILLDLDDFKAVNDTHGHGAGDQALCMIAKTLANDVRSFDVVARWGGEEFLVLLANLTGDQLRARAESLRRFVEQSALSTPAGPVVVTASVGATMARPDDTPESLVERADRLMYRAKAAGRNCVSLD